MTTVWVGMIVDHSDVFKGIAVLGNKEVAIKWFNYQLKSRGIDTNESINDNFKDLYIGKNYLYYSDEERDIEIECDECAVHETEDWVK